MKKYKLEDILHDNEDTEELSDVKDYVGTYVLKRLNFGAKQKLQGSIVKFDNAKFKDEIKSKTVSKENTADKVNLDFDIGAWQLELLVHSIYSCPIGDQGKNGWEDLEKIRGYVYTMPPEIGDELLDIAMKINQLSEEEQKK